MTLQSYTRRARGAMGGLTENEDGEIVDKLVDTLVLSNEQVELAILLQRIGDRISTIGYDYSRYGRILQTSNGRS